MRVHISKVLRLGSASKAVYEGREGEGRIEEEEERAYREGIMLCVQCMVCEGEYS